MSTSEAFEAAVRHHDARLAAAGLTVWVGSEPTFTDRAAQSPQWLSQALGGDKEQRAQALLASIGRRLPGSLVLRSRGRLYPGEDRPRWCLGLYRRRDGAALWQGPPDPILAASGVETLPDLDTWAAALAVELRERGFLVATADGAPKARTAIRDDAAIADAAESGRPRFSLQVRTALSGGRPDDSASSGPHVFELSMPETGGRPTACIEMPKFDALSLFMTALESVAKASLACQLPALIVAGCLPPVDASVELTTITPDPAVIEINTAPSVDAEDFLRRSRAIYAAAADEGLSPYRLYFNGAVADSGGGGQITLGGPSPLTSPFLLQPLLLPRLVAFFNNHPALSYLFSHDYVGSSGQSARADERGTDAFEELGLALSLLGRTRELTPEILSQSLTPFLCDASGNSHRAEINIEKLWNPSVGERGTLGLVEFRALRMQHTPERATALACLLRAITGMLARAPADLSLVDWGRELHDRFALPFHLEQDLGAVLQALDAAGLGLGEAIRAVLMHDEFRIVGQVHLPGCTLEVRRAHEFWPLVGDSASPEQGGTSRLIDASTTRVELRLRPEEPAASGWRDWRILAEGVELPMRQERDASGELQVFGLRYRRFVPQRGLHPMLVALDPVQLILRRPDQPTDYRVTLHEWHPAGTAYDGLPQHLADAGQRRAERLVVERLPRDEGVAAQPPPLRGLSAYGFDLRWLS